MALREAIDSRDALVLLAVADDDRVVGLCTAYHTIHAIRFGHRAWVEELAVDPELRSRGIGSRLLGAAKDWARERGASHLKLDSALDPHRSAPLLRARGAERPLLQLRLRALRVSPAERSAASRSRWNSTRWTRPVHHRPDGRARRLDLDAPVFVLPTMRDQADDPISGVDHALEIDPVALERARPFEPRFAKALEPGALDDRCWRTPGPIITTSKPGSASSASTSPTRRVASSSSSPATTSPIVRASWICSTTRTASADTRSDYPSPAASPTSREPWP